MLDAAARALRPGGRLVVNAVTLETEALLLARHAALGGELIRIAISRAAAGRRKDRLARRDAGDAMDMDEAIAESRVMTVHFIGAGPGAADLITVRGRDLIARCPVCLYAGSIVPRELLDYCPPVRASSIPRRCRSTRSRPNSPPPMPPAYDVARLHSGDLRSIRRSPNSCAGSSGAAFPIR